MSDEHCIVCKAHLVLRRYIDRPYRLPASADPAAPCMGADRSGPYCERCQRDLLRSE